MLVTHQAPRDTHVRQVDLVAGLVKHFDGDLVQAASLKDPPVTRVDGKP